MSQHPRQCWMSEWMSNEDVEEDLLLMAEFQFPDLNDTSKIKVPDSVLEYTKMLQKNQETGIRVGVDENATYVASGRGRGIKDRCIRPGEAVEHHPSDDVDLRKKVRAVVGLGSSNELIEESIRAQIYEPGTTSGSERYFTSSESDSDGPARRRQMNHFQKTKPSSSIHKK